MWALGLPVACRAWMWAAKAVVPRQFGAGMLGRGPKETDVDKGGGVMETPGQGAG